MAKDLMDITPAEMDAIVRDVQATIKAIGSSDLKKGIGDSSEETTPGEVPPEAGKDDIGSASSAPAPEGAPAPDAAPAVDPSAAPSADPSAPQGDPAADQMASPEELEQAYAQLSPEELKAHFLAIKSVVMKMMGGQAGGEAAPAPGPAAPSASPPPAGMPAAKKEIDLGGSGGEVCKGCGAKKSEEDTELETLRKALTEKDLLLGRLEKGLERFVQIPQQRAVTNLADVTDPTTISDEQLAKLNKSEVLNRLGRVASEAKLTKSDRARIDQYTVGMIGIEQVKDLLRK